MSCVSGVLKASSRETPSWSLEVRSWGCCSSSFDGPSSPTIVGSPRTPGAGFTPNEACTGVTLGQAVLSFPSALGTPPCTKCSSRSAGQFKPGLAV